jgi:hypothetical protein
MFGNVLRSTKVRIGLALLLVGLSAFLLNPCKKNPPSILPQMPAAKTPESPAPPPSLQRQAEAARLNDAIARKIDSIVRLIDELTE